MSKPDDHARCNPRWRIPGICIFLAAITFLVFGRTMRDEFINYDDNLYVYGNPLVTAGLTFQGIAHVFTHYESRFYTPLTMISHMADWQIYASWAGGHHLTNVLLHAATVILLFLVLMNLTGAVWRSAFVAALFAIHPLHVESVAWVAERNDVLGGFFFVLTIWAYLHYTRLPGSPVRYLLVMLLFILGLLSKPTLVTLPFILLLLDYWPLKRFARTAGDESGVSLLPRLLVEKLPLLALSVAAGVAAYFAEGKSVASLAMFTVSSRIANALVSCAIYLRQMIWPCGLAIFYPRPAGGLQPWEVVCALAVLVCISGGVFLMRKRCPYLVVGWLWYLCILAPVAGLVQVGEFAHADRYTYLSQIGLYIALTWGAADLCRSLRMPPAAPGVAAMAVIGVLVVCARAQASYWLDSESIFRHALDCTSGNHVACNNLGWAVYKKGRVNDAIAIYRQGLGFYEASAPLHDNLGQALFRKGNLDEAIRQYQRALEIEPGSGAARYNLEIAILTRTAWELAASPDNSLRSGPKAVELAQQANQITGGRNPIVLRALAAACAEAGRFDDAVEAAQGALQSADSLDDAPLLAVLRGEIALYQAGRPVRAVDFTP